MSSIRAIRTIIILQLAAVSLLLPHAIARADVVAGRCDGGRCQRRSERR